MNRLALLALSMLGFAAAPAWSVEVLGELTPADLAAVTAVAAKADDRWNAADAAGLSALYTEDGNLSLVDSNVTALGRRAVLDYFTRSFATRPASLRHSTDVERLVVLSPTVVLVDTQVAVDELLADGSHKRLRNFYTLTIVEKTGGEWLISVVRAHVLRTPSTSA
jgi:uncharacterized protein (TIGR02246 family)